MQPLSSDTPRTEMDYLFFRTTLFYPPLLFHMQGP